MLNGNKLGGTIPTDVVVFTNLKTLGLSEMGLEGELSTRTERISVLLTFTFSAGKLPEQLGQLTKLTGFDASHNKLTGALSTRTELHQTTR